MRRGQPLPHERAVIWRQRPWVWGLGALSVAVACTTQAPDSDPAVAPTSPPTLTRAAGPTTLPPPPVRGASVVSDAPTAAFPDAGAEATGDSGSEAAVGDASDDAAPPVDLSAQPFAQPLDARRILPPTSYARRFANLSPAQCMKQLRTAKLPVKHWGGAAKGVANPHKLNGALSGVSFVFPGGKSPFGVLDCRLVLALNEFARVLAKHDVVRVQLDNMYRPHSKLPRHRRGKPRNPSQHSYGLAADITRFWLADGSVLSVEDDWHGELGATACGPDALLSDPDADSVRLRNLVCDVAREGIFTHMLTPGFNAAHRTHFHFDIKRGADYQALR
ncbi:MAG: extensin family protein [Polyangiaceae bacterium]